MYVTLDEINKGCVKKMKISKRVLQSDGSPKREDKYVSISVKPGWKAGTRVTFQKEGDQQRGKIPADIVFIIRDKPHAFFKRDGSDIRYTARLTLKQVSSSSALRIITTITADVATASWAVVAKYGRAKCEEIRGQCIHLGRVIIINYIQPTVEAEVSRGSSAAPQLID